MKKVLSVWISLLSLLLSVIAVCVAVWRSPELGFDYQGVLVGVLSLLVTVLLGWNIYTLVDIRDTRERLNEVSSGAMLNIQKNMVVSEHSFFMIYHYLLLEKDPLGLEYRFMYHGIACLYHASKIHDIQTCNVLVKAMLECFTNPEDLTINKNMKRDIFRLLKNVEHSEEIKGFYSLYERIALVNVR